MTAMTCERFEAILPDYFEGDLSDEAKAAADAHLKTCESCAAIVADIDRISREAAALPAMHPARDLWSGIEERISAPVIPLANTQRKNVRRFGSAWMAAAAAALVIATSGITYVATTRMNAGTSTRVARIAPTGVKPAGATDSGAVAVTTETPAGGKASPRNVEIAAASPKVQATATNPRSRSVETQTRAVATLASSAGSPRTNATLASAPQLGSIQADAQYAHEISTLERMINAPNSGLDSATVLVVKRNLQVIDDAIAQSKAALAKDPASQLLYDQVTRAMGKKVELLRTMASLSSSE